MKYFRLTALFVLAFSAWTCSTDFVLEAEWKDIPVVYAFLDPTDSVHYVRVEKAFLEEGGDALEIARIPDSLYYENATVQLQKIGSSILYTLERVDGNLEGFPREDGVFATAPNYLYKIRQSNINLDGGDQVRFLLKRGDELPVVTAEIVMLDPIVPLQNQPPNPINFSTYERAINVSFNPGPHAQLFDIRWIIHYMENTPENPQQFVSKTLTWVLQSRLEREEGGANSILQRVQSEDFFLFLAGSLDADPNRVRKFENIDIQITAVGQELADYIRVSGANLGITSSNQIPVYTNLSEGRGLFSSRTDILLTGYQLNDASLTLLKTGPLTQNLNFQ